MRVGYLTYGLDRNPNGIGRYALELLHSMAALPEGPEIVLLTTEREDPQGLWDRFEHHALPGCYRLPALMTAGNLFLWQAAQRYRLDLIHDPNGVAPFLSPKSEARRVVTFHDAFAYVQPETHNRLDNWRYFWMLPTAARRADAILTVSECSQRDLCRYLRLQQEQVHVTSEGVNPHFQPVDDQETQRAVVKRYGIEKPYLLYIGGLNARKNIARLLEAYARVRVRFPQLTLVIGGKRQWRTDTIDTSLERLNLEPYVRFTGYLEDADLPALYSAAELFVFPSLYEGFGLPVLEAMACGTPVVSSNAASLPEVTGDAALTIDPYDVNGLVDAIELVLCDLSLRETLRQRGFQQASRYTWERAAVETLAIYQKVLKSSSMR